MKQIKVLPNFLTQEEWDKTFWDYLSTPKWGFGHNSDTDSLTVSAAPTYWKMELKHDKFFNF